ncbi:MAG: cysteine desulfurase family protein [Myxococcota bacterium]
MGTRPIYLDNHATTRCDPAVVAAMLPWFSDDYGNAASRSHAYGAEARAATEAARGRIAGWLGASAKEVVFTSGATEANNLAILGGARARRRATGHDHVVTVATEHAAVLDPVRALADDGFRVTIVPVGADGRVDPDAIAAALTPTTALASVMWVNNEIGVIHPIAAIGAACRAAGVWLHCDAAQAGYVPIDWATVPVDLLSVSAHKLYGPKGVGALLVRRTRPRIALVPLQYGGGHERGLRSGTLPVPLIVGFGVAAGLIVDRRDVEVPRVRALRDRLWDALVAGVDGIRWNGHPTERSPNNLNLAIDGVEATALLMAVRSVVALSTGSACSSETLAPSHVLRALGLPDDAAHRSIRIGVGRFTTEAEIDAVAAALIAGIRGLRGMGGLYEP